ncbi:uncharacterized protein LOC108906549 [Anoplophora glabripennis]|uniref:uncharacterized protein LOC108906549 n=1 Tax=Anoplophora glabripennis TaxID=217634 RepID=UPI000873E066|nr:uncharacterized protein LOC108906549 [Anoplophora glabripennis]
MHSSLKLNLRIKKTFSIHRLTVCSKMFKCSISKITSVEYGKLPQFKIVYGTADTKYGKIFMGLKNDAVCFISFVDGNYDGLSDLKKSFPKAAFTEDDQAIFTKSQTLFDETSTDEVKVLLKGTEFQTKVWEELVNLPRGSTCSYEDLAKAIGNPKAVRAVANAVAKNNVSYLVPCHRVISKGGGLGKYHWGAERKLKILKDENAV